MKNIVRKIAVAAFLSSAYVVFASDQFTDVTDPATVALGKDVPSTLAGSTGSIFDPKDVDNFLKLYTSDPKDRKVFLDSVLATMPKINGVAGHAKLLANLEALADGSKSIGDLEAEKKGVQALFDAIKKHVNYAIIADSLYTNKDAIDFKAITNRLKVTPGDITDVELVKALTPNISSDDLDHDVMDKPGSNFDKLIISKRAAKIETKLVGKVDFKDEHGAIKAIIDARPIDFSGLNDAGVVTSLKKIPALSLKTDAELEPLAHHISETILHISNAATEEAKERFADNAVKDSVQLKGVTTGPLAEFRTLLGAAKDNDELVANFYKNNVEAKAHDHVLESFKKDTVLQNKYKIIKEQIPTLADKIKAEILTIKPAADKITDKNGTDLEILEAVKELKAQSFDVNKFSATLESLITSYGPARDELEGTDGGKEIKSAITMLNADNQKKNDILGALIKEFGKPLSTKKQADEFILSVKNSVVPAIRTVTDFESNVPGGAALLDAYFNDRAAKEGLVKKGTTTIGGALEIDEDEYNSALTKNGLNGVKTKIDLALGDLKIAKKKK